MSEKFGAFDKYKVGHRVWRATGWQAHKKIDWLRHDAGKKFKSRMQPDDAKLALIGFVIWLWRDVEDAMRTIACGLTGQNLFAWDKFQGLRELEERLVWIGEQAEAKLRRPYPEELRELIQEMRLLHAELEMLVFGKWPEKANLEPAPPSQLQPRGWSVEDEGRSVWSYAAIFELAQRVDVLFDDLHGFLMQISVEKPDLSDPPYDPPLHDRLREIMK